MFESLTSNLSNVIKKLKNKSVILEKDFDEAMREIRVALLEADVPLQVAKDFINDIKSKIIGENTLKGIPPAKMIVKMVHDNLIKVMGSEKYDLNISKNEPSVIMMVGLQGAGKTTTTAKLALKIKKKNKRVLMASLDTYRPAAQHQLEILGKQSAIEVLPIIKNEKPIEIAKRAQSLMGQYDVLLLDTAGRLHIDQDMMDELKNIKELTNPIEIILVADAMIGQDSVNVAKSFNEALSLTGIVLTRIDGDSRGGAALAMKTVANCPIKFLATGEKLSDLEEFHPDRIAQRILNMGDIVSLVEKAAEIVGEDEIENLKNKVQKGQFDLNDLLAQLKTLNKMGGFASILKFLPNIGNIKQSIGGVFDDTKTKKYIAIINSMTKQERVSPKIINGTRKVRIAKGSGVKVNDVNTLLKQYAQMNSMVNQFSNMDHSKLKQSDLMKLLKFK